MIKVYRKECWDGEEWYVEFKRPLSSRDFDRWLQLCSSLAAVDLAPGCTDIVLWALEKNRVFSTKSLYRFITNRGMPSRVAGHIWKCKIPLKIKFFLWQMFNNKLQVAMSLIKRGWKGTGRCCICNASETIDHIFFHCYLAKLLWGIIKEVFHLPHIPNSLKEFCEEWLQGKGPIPARLLMFLFAGFTWALWITRNKMAIEKKFPKAPTDVMHIGLSFLQKWAILLQEEDRERLGNMKEEIIQWMKQFRPSTVMLSDVVEI